MIDNVVANVSRQSHVFDVVVVENGDAVGICEARGFRPTKVLTSGNHQSLAKNEGLMWGMANGYSHFSTNDDDDYYGKEYNSELAEALSRGHLIVGKRDGFVRFSNGVMCYQDCGGHEIKTTGLHGPTISGKLYRDMPLFNTTMVWGEDWDWIHDSSKNGDVFATSIHHFCYMRRGKGHGHAFPHSDEQLLSFSSAKFYECGEFSEDVINGVVELPHLNELDKPALPYTENPAYQALMA